MTISQNYNYIININTSKDNFEAHSRTQK